MQCIPEKNKDQTNFKNNPKILQKTNEKHLLIKKPLYLQTKRRFPPVVKGET